MSRGFTLLESLVALVILSLILTTAYRIFSGGVLGISRDEQRVQMSLIAEGLLARARLGETLERGASGTYRWQVTRAEFEVRDRDAAALSGSVFDSEDDQSERHLDEITVTVRNSAGAEIELRSLVVAGGNEA